MQRVIKSPTYYNGTALQEVTIDAADDWDFPTDKDIKIVNEINASAQEEFDYSVLVTTPTAIAATYASAICQKVLEKRITQENVCWHYAIDLSVVITGTTQYVIKPFVMQNEDADADSTRVQFLQAEQHYASTSLDTHTMHSCGAVVRRKQGISGAKDTNGLVFGVFVWNVDSGNALNIEGLLSMSVHPNNLPLVVDQAGV